MSKVIDKLELAIEVNKLLEDMYPDVYCGVTTAKNDAYLVLRDKKLGTRFPNTENMDDILAAAKELHSDGFTKVTAICSDLVGTVVWINKELPATVDDISKDSVITVTGKFALDSLWKKD